MNNKMTHMVTGICLFVFSFAIAFMSSSIDTDAARKTVYVVTGIKCKNASGRLIDTYSFKYNKNGLIKKQTMSTYGSQNYAISYTYDKNNQLIKGTSGKNWEKYIYENGLLVQKIIGGAGYDDPYSSYYIYNKKNQPIRCEGGDGFLWDKWTYNKKGQLVTSNEMPSKYKYDSKGYIKKEWWDGKLSRIYNTTYISKNSTRRKSVACRYGNRKLICTYYYTYKKMRVDQKNVKAIKRQQTPQHSDPLYGFIPV